MDRFLSLRVFKAVVEKGAFNKAAEALGMPTSSVSKAIRELEADLNVKLLLRTTRKLTVTQEGLEYYARIGPILDELETIDSEISGKRYQPKGHLRVDCQVAFASRFLIPALNQFQILYPHVTIGLGINDKAADLLGEGIDCVIRVGGEQIPGMVERKLMDLEFVTCASPELIQKLGSLNTPHALKNEYPTVSYFRTTSTHPMPLVFTKGNDRVEIEDCAFSCNNGSELLNLILHGLGVGQHARIFVDPYIQSGELIELFPDWHRPTMPLNIVYPPNRSQSARLQAFIDWMIATFRK